MSSLEEVIIKARPNLSKNSIKTYNSILKNLYYRGYPNDKDIDIKKFGNVKHFVSVLKETDPIQRKTYYSALLIISNEKDKEEYKNLMLNDINQYNNFINENKKNDKERKNWISQEDILKIRDSLKPIFNYVLKKDNINMDDLQKAQQYIIISLYTMIEPRRLLDYTNMIYTKPKNISEDDNYIDKNVFIFNKYKTSKFYKSQNIEIPKELLKILKQWINLIKKYCPNNNYLLFDNNCNKLNVVQLNQRLNKIFNNKISVNMLRHIYITNEMNKPITNLKELKESSKNMAHSIQTHLEYIKN